MSGNNGSEYLLDLSTEEALPSVQIDGQAYALRLDVEYAELMRLKDIGKRLEEIDKAAERTEQEEAELGELLRREVIGALKAPEAVLAKLTDLQRMRIVKVFVDRIEAVLGPTTAATKTSRA